MSDEPKPPVRVEANTISLPSRLTLGMKSSKPAAEFGVVLIGGQLSYGPPDPTSRLGRADAIQARMDAGEITEEVAHAQVKEIVREVMSEADGIWVSGDLLKPELRHLGGRWIPFERE